MTELPRGRAASLSDAREAKTLLRGESLLSGYVNGIGIAHGDAGYCVRVNLEKKPPSSIFSAFPRTVVTAHGEVPIVYQVVGTVSAA